MGFTAAIADGWLSGALRFCPSLTGEAGFIIDGFTFSFGLTGMEEERREKKVKTQGEIERQCGLVAMQEN